MLYLSYDFPNLRALVTPVIKIRRGSLKVVPNAHVKKKFIRIKTKIMSGTISKYWYSQHKDCYSNTSDDHK